MASGRATDTTKTPIPAKVGRPSEYNKETADQICDFLADGETLSEICVKPDMPHRGTIWKWRTQNKEFDDAYARARRMQMEAWETQLLEIADDGRNDWMTVMKGGREVDVENHEVVKRSILRVDTRKWLMARIHAQKYGEKIEQTQIHEVGDSLRQLHDDIRKGRTRPIQSVDI